MKKLLIFSVLLVLGNGVSADEPAQKGKIEIGGASYAYLDHCTLWTGPNGIHHIIAVHLDAPEFASVGLATPPISPRLLRPSSKPRIT